MKTEKTLKLSAGAIVVEAGKLLLVHHGTAAHGRHFLVPPGGRLEGDESFPHTVIRETREEIGLDVRPGRLLFVEDMVSSRKRVVKFWFLCSVVGGKLSATPEASEEGIIEARWYRREEIAGWTVYPTILSNTDWSAFLDDAWQTEYLENRDDDADF